MVREAGTHKFRCGDFKGNAQYSQLAQDMFLGNWKLSTGWPGRDGSRTPLDAVVGNTRSATRNRSVNSRLNICLQGACTKHNAFLFSTATLQIHSAVASHGVITFGLMQARKIGSNSVSDECLASPIAPLIMRALAKRIMARDLQTMVSSCSTLIVQHTVKW